MKLEKAIAIQTNYLIGPACLSNLDLKDATKLGIESMKDTLASRVKGYRSVEHALPGETREE